MSITVFLNLIDIKLDCANSSLFKYLQFIDRGGLKYSKEDIVNIVINTYVVLKILISEKYKSTFLKVQSQKHFLLKNVLKLYESHSLSIKICFTCGITHSRGDTIRKCVGTLANILLNNYRNNKNELQKALKENEKLKSSVFCI